jgi:pyrimidine operon attenuation protein / uracil phosphoribosyltransferase
MQVLLSSKQLKVTIQRLAHQLIEDYESLANVVFIGIQPRGVKLSERITDQVKLLCPHENVQYGLLDITFYRDDVRKEFHTANKTELPFSLEGKIVILIDDVLYTGRTIRAALDALQDFGRPEKVVLCVLVDRSFSRELPIQPDYCGKSIDSLETQKVKVEWQQEEVVLY